MINVATKNCLSPNKLSRFVAVSMLVILVLSLCGCGNDKAEQNENNESAIEESLENEETNVTKTLDDYSWEELSVISEEIAATQSEDEAIEVAKSYNLVASDGKLDGAQTKSVELSNGTIVEVQIAGFRHDDKTSGGKAGITFIFKDIIAEHPMNSTNTNEGGWKNSQMRAWLASAGMDMLPSDLSSRIVEVDKMSNNVGASKSKISATSTPDKLWLFSTTELCGKASSHSTSQDYVQITEGNEYKLFRDQDVNSTATNLILYRESYWWVRSADPIQSHGFMYVTSFGQPDQDYNNYASITYSVVPGFCI